MAQIRKTAAHPKNSGFGHLNVRVRNARMKLKMTQAQLAQESLIAQSTISKIETGGSINLDVFTAIRLASSLQTTVEALFDNIKSKEYYKWADQKSA